MVSYFIQKSSKYYFSNVLILIVVDNGLVQSVNIVMTLGDNGLNPYCSGQWSRTINDDKRAETALKSLNPYCSGQWSSTCLSLQIPVALSAVLILVVVDNGLVPVSLSELQRRRVSLNPCCSGQWSSTCYLVI